MIFRIFLSAFALLFGGVGAHAASLFSDVPPDHEYFSAIATLQQRKVVNGFGDGRFGPEDRVSRAASLKIILLAAGAEVGGVLAKNPFPDVPKDEWFAPMVKKARDAGIVRGDGDGNFLPSRHVSRSEALAMLFRTNGGELATPKEEPYKDVSLNAWYAPYFSAARRTGLIKSEWAKPDHLLTRGELSDLTVRFFQNEWRTTEMTGKASYYGNQFEGKTTANGEPFSNTDFTAAHRTLPFGTRVRVTNMETLASVVVRITDRGPFVSDRVIDLSKSAFEAIVPASSGVSVVELKKVSEETPIGPSNSCEDTREISTIPRDFFNGIQLLRDIPAGVRKGEIVEISGRITKVFDTPPSFVRVLVDDKIFIGPVTGSVFRIPIFFEKAGNRTIKIAFEKNAPISSNTPDFIITVYDQKCEGKNEAETSAPENLHLSLKNGLPVAEWTDNKNTLFRIRLTQKEKEATFFLFDRTNMTLPLSAFSAFEEGPVTTEIWGSVAKENSFGRRSAWKKGKSFSFFALPHISRTQNTPLQIDMSDSFSPNSPFSFSGTTEIELAKEVVITTPQETTITVPLLREGKNFSATFTPTLSGLYVVEINDVRGFATFVAGIVPAGTFPLIPDFFDLQKKGGDIAPENRQKVLLKLVNKSRREKNIPEVKSDDNLNALAQFRADDMCARQYFGHIDPEGKKTTDYRTLYGVQTSIAENIAQGDSISGLHAQIMRSPGHRTHVFAKHFSRMGVGFCKNENQLIMVQLFGGEPFNPNRVPEWRNEILSAVNGARGNTAIVPNAVLESVAQRWANRMAEEQFLGFESGNLSLAQEIKEAGITLRSEVMILKIGSMDDFLSAVDKDPLIVGESQPNILLNTQFFKMGVGMAQDENWNIFITLITTP